MDPDKTQDYYTTDEDFEKKDTISFDGDRKITDADPSTVANGDGTPARKKHPWRKALILLSLVVVVALAIIVYIRYYNPYITDAKVRGYVTNVERRGIIFKTYEGEMISEQSLTDTVRVYSRDFTFSIPDEQMARELQAIQGTGRQVTITYSRYYGVLPWRGASTAVLTSIE